MAGFSQVARSVMYEGMSAEVACESNTRTYTSQDLRSLHRGVAIDACTSDPFCGNAVPQKF